MMQQIQMGSQGSVCSAPVNNSNEMINTNESYSQVDLHQSQETVQTTQIVVEDNQINEMRDEDEYDEGCFFRRCCNSGILR